MCVCVLCHVILRTVRRFALRVILCWGGVLQSDACVLALSHSTRLSLASERNKQADHTALRRYDHDKAFAPGGPLRLALGCTHVFILGATETQNPA